MPPRVEAAAGRGAKRDGIQPAQGGGRGRAVPHEPSAYLSAPRGVPGTCSDPTASGARLRGPNRAGAGHGYSYGYGYGYGYGYDYGCQAAASATATSATATPAVATAAHNRQPLLPPPPA